MYKEFEAISEHSGVLGAMDTMYQRGKIQDESMYYEHKKHDGSLPLIGVNTFLPKEHAGEIATEIELIRSTEEEKGAQIANVRSYGEARNALASDSLKVLQTTARERRNVFEQLIEAVKYNSLGQISHALYEVGGIGGICEAGLTGTATALRVAPRSHINLRLHTDELLSKAAWETLAAGSIIAGFCYAIYRARSDGLLERNRSISNRDHVMISRLRVAAIASNRSNTVASIYPQVITT